MKTAAPEKRMDSFKRIDNSSHFSSGYPDRDRILPDYNFVVDSVEIHSENHVAVFEKKYSRFFPTLFYAQQPAEMGYTTYD